MPVWLPWAVLGSLGPPWGALGCLNFVEKLYVIQANALQVLRLRTKMEPPGSHPRIPHIPLIPRINTKFFFGRCQDTPSLVPGLEGH